MDQQTREILAANLVAAMAAFPELGTFALITAAGGPSNGTLDRIRRKESGCSIDQLTLLSKAFKVITPWQWLMPDLDVEALKKAATQRSETQALQARVAALEAQLRELTPAPVQKVARARR